MKRIEKNFAIGTPDPFSNAMPSAAVFIMNCSKRLTTSTQKMRPQSSAALIAKTSLADPSFKGRSKSTSATNRYRQAGPGKLGWHEGSGVCFIALERPSPSHFVFYISPNGSVCRFARREGRSKHPRSPSGTNKLAPNRTRHPIGNGGKPGKVDNSRRPSAAPLVFHVFTNGAVSFTTPRDYAAIHAKDGSELARRLGGRVFATQAGITLTGESDITQGEASKSFKSQIQESLREVNRVAGLSFSRSDI
jgi:hypothetical protein